MKRLALILSVTLLFWGETTGQTAASKKTEASPTTPDLVEANKLSEQALALYDIRKYSDALPLAKRVVELRERALGSEHELVASALANVAEIYIGQLKYDDAEALYKRALSILERRWGAESKHLVLTLERLALVHFAKQDFGSAERSYVRALAITEKSFGPNAIESGQSLEMLAVFYDRTGKQKKAAEFFERSLAIQDKVLDASDNRLVNLLYRCACSLAQVGQPDKAKVYIERAQKGSPSAPVDKGVLQGIAIHRVQPAYPYEAKIARVSGRVLVQVLVDECGRVIEASSLAGHIELVPAALRAAREWRFTPTKLLGRPVKVIGTITFNFTL